MLKIGITAGGDLESFVTTARSDDCVCGSNSRNDVFDDTLSQGVGYAWDVVFFGASEGSFVEPGDVAGVVGVEDVVFSVFLPGDNVGPLDAVLWLTRDGCKGT